MKQLLNMNENRVYSGICIDEFVNNKVFICVEYLLPKTEKHSSWPLIWNDETKIVKIASTTTKRKSFAQLDLRENKWMDYMSNNKNSFDDLFGVTRRNMLVTIML